jgi:phosphoenolpyruvate synthase/pyruvate phosphate dikinase
MEPGTILVCPTTTLAWTPLFSQARGLVTDVGGVLAHGSIVAREFGIPAVPGTGEPAYPPRPAHNRGRRQGTGLYGRIRSQPLIS